MSDAVVASIGTTHPWNIAGVGLDVRIGAELGVRVVAAVAAVSVQDAQGLHALHAVPIRELRAQLRTISLRDLVAIRVGALPSANAVVAVAGVLRAFPHVPAVVDPVLTASLGGTFADEPTVDALRSELAAIPSVILTPNLDEGARLLRCDAISRGSLADAARSLHAFGSRAVLLKGGHLEGRPADALAAAGGVETLEDERLPHDMRGTGCTLAMALASELARGALLRDAVIRARQFTRGKIAHAHTFQGLRVAY